MEDKVICNKSDLVNTADAIRSKLGVTDTYYVSELSSAIQSIETGGIVPSGTISITENGTVDVIQYASAEVNVSSSPSLQSKSVTYTSNGTATITPDAGYDGLRSVDVTVNVSGGGGGGAGFSVTFPATATNWDKSRGARLFLYNGSTIEINSYSTVAGKKVDGVVGLTCGRKPGTFWVLKMALASGTILQASIIYSVTNDGSIFLRNYAATQSGGSTATPYNATNIFWWPLADTVISAIEMYNTD